MYYICQRKKTHVSPHIFLSMNELNLTVDDSREAHYEQVLSPFEEFLPGIRPTNSDGYILMLADAMHKQGLDEPTACLHILDGHPFPLDEQHVKELVAAAFQPDFDSMELLDFNKTQRRALSQRAFMQRRYTFRHNEVLGVVEYCERKKYHLSYRPVTDRAINSIALNAQEEGIDMRDNDVKIYLNSDRVCTYNPFDEYLNALPKWDGRKRIDKFFRRVPVNDELWYDLAHTWFLGMVALWNGQNRRKGNETMLVLVGEQGVGKSTFCRSLMPKELTPYYTENFSLANRRKALLMLSRYGLINFDEVNRLTEAQQPVLKNMLQLPVVDEFKPYASTSVQERRYASLMGTSNNHDIIADLTGSRRYLCALVTGKIDTTKKVNHDQLYAEALHELKAGRRYWLNEEEEAALTERNMRFVRMPAAAEEFDTLFEVASEGDAGAEWLYATEIHALLHPTIHKPMTNSELRTFSTLMNSRHILSKRSNGGMRYLVKRKPLPESV